MNILKSTLFLICLLLIASCNQNEAQREFEDEAFREPENITETNSQGEVISLDEDDWRTSPMYQGIIEVNPPFPNPATGNTAINFEININSVQSISALELVVRYSDGIFDTIYFNTNNDFPVGLLTFQISSIQLGKTNTIESARGLHRVFLYDQNSRLISYGDIQVN